MKIAIGIPARFDSSRFPGKPLADIAGKPMIAHVIERAQSSKLGPVIVATDDKRIANIAEHFGAQVAMTSSSHHSGSTRLAEAMRYIDCDVVINVQGDEPLIEPAAIHAVVKPFAHDPLLTMATLAHPIRHEDDFNDPNVVKVVCNAKGHAMYFSRSPIPFIHHQESEHPNIALQHVGLYAYKKTFLMMYDSLTSCESERLESLEQLRVLHHGYPIAVTVGDFHTIGVDTPDDLNKVAALLDEEHSE